MKTQALIMTLLLTGLPVVTAHAAYGFTVGLSDGSPLVGNRRCTWPGCPRTRFPRYASNAIQPDERERLRKKLRDDTRCQRRRRLWNGLQSPRRDTDTGDNAEQAAWRWGKPRSGDKSRDERRGRR